MTAGFISMTAGFILESGRRSSTAATEPRRSHPLWQRACTAKVMSRISTVILDIDGTLLLSNDAHARAFVEAAAEMGIQAGFAEIRRLVGKGGDKLIPEVFGFESESAQGKKLDELKGKIFNTRYLPTLLPAPGARALLSRLRDDNRTLVVATSANGEDIKKLLERAGVRDLVEDSASGDDVAESKPDPDVVNAALKKAGAKPDAAIMLGDTPYDVEAARAAGVPIIAVRCGGWSDAELHGAVAIYDNPAAILTRYNEAF
jgi:HAD superfamily hydrolase (TIGR01509 family)